MFVHSSEQSKCGLSRQYYYRIQINLTLAQFLEEVGNILAAPLKHLG